MINPRTDPQYKLRMPKTLKAAIEASAEELNRTINADIVARLSASFEGQTATLRDQFAMHGAAALINAISRSTANDKITPWSEIAEGAYYLADAMLEAREKKP